MIIPITIEGEQVTTLGASAFQYNGLTSVTIAGSVTSMEFGEYAKVPKTVEQEIAKERNAE